MNVTQEKWKLHLLLTIWVFEGSLLKLYNIHWIKETERLCLGPDKVVNGWNVKLWIVEWILYLPDVSAKTVK